nr:EOG090X00BV [Artemia franciscana]
MGLSKEFVHDPTPSRVNGVTFGIGSNVQIKKNSVARVPWTNEWDFHGKLELLVLKMKVEDVTPVNKIGLCVLATLAILILNAKEDDPEFLKFKEEQDEAMSKNRWLEAFQGEYVKFINPQMCLNLFEKISEDDASILMLRQAKNEKSLNYPVDLILTRLPVAPSCIRPTVQSDLKDSTNEDDITVVIRNIVIVNETLLEGLRNGSLSSSKMQETWDILQMKVALLFDGDPRYIPQDVERQSYRGFVQRLKGKQGRFRQNLEGKRCNFTARSVISPDPNLKIDQVGVPRLIAQTLTFPEKVTPANIEWLKKLVINGSKHPGANSVLPSSPEVKRYNLGFLDENKRKLYASKLRNGDTVYRHLHDDDIVLFNRQPSLHRMSIMSHRVKVLEGRTLRFNECACTPYNADFDGDEMNLHFPQTQEARTEAATLMDIKQNLITPRNGEILVALTQDFITGAYLLSRKDCFLDKNKAQQLMAQILVHEDASLKFEMPVPAILKPAKLWTGKQIISFIFKHYQNEGVEGGKVKINLRAPGKLYERDKRLLEMDPSDSYLIIRNSDIISELPRNNAPLIMALSGSKGSNINIAQMVVCVGQQALNGKRVPNGFDERSLPHFKKKSKEPDSRGFVSASFYSGLKPPEFVFHAMAGREGLVDTAVKTAETGYIQRRLMKCLEDIVTEYDGSVRTSSSDLIQIRYGGDGFDPVMMETETFPIDLEKAIERSCLLISDLHGKKLKTRDVKQGNALSPRLFGIFVNDIVESLEKRWAPTVKLDNRMIWALLFADDMALVAKTARELRILIDLMAEYLESKKLRLNLGKTEIMIFNKGGRRNLVENEKFRFKGQEIKVVEKAKYLGFTLTPNRSWKEHVSEM